MATTSIAPSSPSNQAHSSHETRPPPLDRRKTPWFEQMDYSKFLSNPEWNKKKKPPSNFIAFAYFKMDSTAKSARKLPNMSRRETSNLMKKFRELIQATWDITQTPIPKQLGEHVNQSMLQVIHLSLLDRSHTLTQQLYDNYLLARISKDFYGKFRGRREYLTGRIIKRMESIHNHHEGAKCLRLCIDSALYLRALRVFVCYRPQTILNHADTPQHCGFNMTMLDAALFPSSGIRSLPFITLLLDLNTTARPALGLLEHRTEDRGNPLHCIRQKLIAEKNPTQRAELEKIEKMLLGERVLNSPRLLQAPAMTAPPPLSPPPPEPIIPESVAAVAIPVPIAAPPVPVIVAPLPQPKVVVARKPLAPSRCSRFWSAIGSPFKCIGRVIAAFFRCLFKPFLRN